MNDALSRKDATLTIHLDGEGVSIYGTRSAYQRLALTLLNASLQANDAEEPALLEVDAAVLLNKDADHPDFPPYVASTPPSRRKESEGSSSWWNVGTFLMARILIIVIFARIGIAAIVRLFFHL